MKKHSYLGHGYLGMAAYFPQILGLWFVPWDEAGGQSLGHLKKVLNWAYRIERPVSSCRRPHSLNIFSSETTGPIRVEFHMELLCDGGSKVCSNGPGHMTKMAAMPIYGKNLKKSYSLEPKGRWPWNLVCIIGCLSTTKFAQMMTLGWPWHILRQG